MTGLNVHREIDVYWPVATAVRHYIRETDESLSLAIIKCVTLRVIKKFDSKGCIRYAVQASLNVGVTAAAYD